MNKLRALYLRQTEEGTAKLWQEASKTPDPRQTLQDEYDRIVSEAWEDDVQTDDNDHSENVTDDYTSPDTADRMIKISPALLFLIIFQLSCFIVMWSTEDLSSSDDPQSIAMPVLGTISAAGQTFRHISPPLAWILITGIGLAEIKVFVLGESIPAVMGCFLGLVVAVVRFHTSLLEFIARELERLSRQCKLAGARSRRAPLTDRRQSRLRAVDVER